MIHIALADRAALEEALRSGEDPGPLLDRLEGAAPPPPGPEAAAILAEAAALADALAGLEEAFHRAGLRRARRRSSARSLGGALQRRAALLASESRIPMAPGELVEEAARVVLGRRRRAIDRMEGEIRLALAPALAALRAACPPGPPATAALHAALDALEADTRGRTRWEGAFAAIEDRLAALERAHRLLRARALLDAAAPGRS